MLFLCLAQLPLWAQSSDYNPANPGDPQVPIRKYSLKLKASPSNGCSFNYASEQKWEASKQIYVEAYPNSGFQMVAWVCGKDTLSRERGFYYTMPERNVELTALLKYNPKNPENPEEMNTKYTVQLTASPTNGGSFNFSSDRFTAGSSIDLYAYPNNGFVFRKWMSGDSVISKEQSFRFVVPKKKTQLTAIFEYDPQNPDNPNKNYWNKELGEVIVDDFKPGNLSRSIWSAINGTSTSDVQMITVAGKMNDYDFGVANEFSNCTLLDISRVTGITEIPSYAFDNTNLESVCLPASIEKIGYNAFAYDSRLASVTIYAMTPPSVDEKAFRDTGEGLVVYVPASSLPLYQEANVWKDFTLLPIQDDIHSLAVSLPEGIDTKLYEQMWIELTNTKSGQKMHYVMTNRTTYTFANLIKNTSWNVTLRNQRGDVFAQLNDVEVKDEDVNVTFKDVAMPQDLNISVTTPDGNDVTNQVQVTWLDETGSYLAQTGNMSGLLAGSKLSYRLALSQELAMEYTIPAQTTYTVKENDNVIKLQLNPLQTVKVSGKVKDLVTRNALDGATISASQTFGGKYTKTISGKTNAQGFYELELSNVPTSITFNASDYISQSSTYENLAASKEEQVDLGEIALKPISGATINLSFNYRKCEDGNAGEGNAQNWFSDYNNVIFGIYNKTQKRTISQYNVQYPQIVLLEEVNEGDVLEITATSKTSAFMPTSSVATIDGQMKANTNISIVELGKIEASYGKNFNGSVVGSLYDAAGKLVKTYDYSNASLTISNLTDGYYTLISMGSSKLFNTMYELQQLKQSGLKSGSDYVETSVKVESGNIAKVVIDQIPTLNESKLYYTGENTSFTVNKQSIVAGNYLTLTGKIDFKLAYAKKVSNVNLVVDIPEACSFVENSVMVGNTTSTYSLEGNRLTIPMARYTDRVRFCVIPTLGGEYAPSAMAQFDINGKTVTQPIGSATYTAKDLSINVPATVAKTQIAVSGTAVGRSEILIYDGDVLIGQTTSLANGMWNSKCELNDAYNLSRHNIFAKVTTRQGVELRSETKECLYDENAIEVKTVTMSFYNGWMRKNLEVTFDFENNKTSESSYQFYTGTDFTFVADLTNNDTTKVNGVTLFIYTSGNEVRPLEAKYDKKRDKWIATSKFESDNLPVNISAKIDAETSAILDIEQWKEMVGSINNLIESYRKNGEIIKTLFNGDEPLSDEEMAQKLEELGLDATHEVDISDIQTAIANMSDEQLEQFLEKEYQSKLSTSDSLLKTLTAWQELLTFDPTKECEFSLSNGATLKLKKSDGYSKEKLLEDGFQCYAFNDSSEVFIKTLANQETYVDLKRGIYLEITTSATSEKNLNLAKKDGDKKGFIQYAQEGIKQINDVVDKINKMFGNLLEKAGQATKVLENAIEEIEFRLAKADFYIEAAGKKGMKGEVLKWKVEKLLLQKNLFLAKDALKTANGCFKRLFKALPVVGYLAAAADLISDMNTLITYYKAIPDPCPEDQINADTYKSQCFFLGGTVIALATADLVGSFTSDAEIVAGIVGSFASAGISLAGTVWGIVQKGVVKLARLAFDWAVDKQIENLGKNIAALKCIPQGLNPIPPLPPFDPLNPIHDPSGYVYEAVASNRLQGVTATCYYKETVEDMYGDLHENIVKWDAEEYAQENPLFTDENGMYQWDVPQGMWQVKFEKDGYETTHSEWLPVPPPQLEVNIGMKQNVQPAVKMAKAYEDAVEVEFDKYMMPELLTTENLIVMDGENAAKAQIKLLNAESAYADESEIYASRIRIEAEKPFENKDITLMVSNRVKSYAGIRMQDDYQQKFTIEPEVRKILCDSTATIGYGQSAVINVEVLPASAAAGKTLLVTSSSGMIAHTETTSITLGEDGKAAIEVSGELPGTASLFYTIDGYELEASTMVKVEQLDQQLVATPTANIASGSAVNKGTAITLACATQGATIYYTLDGSCPCLNTEARKVYDGTPIIIDETVTIKAMATEESMYDSDVAEFTYVVDSTSGIRQITCNEDDKTDKTFDTTGKQVYKNTKGILVTKSKKYINK